MCSYSTLHLPNFQPFVACTHNKANDIISLHKSEEEAVARVTAIPSHSKEWIGRMELFTDPKGGPFRRFERKQEDG